MGWIAGTIVLFVIMLIAFFVGMAFNRSRIRRLEALNGQVLVPDRRGDMPWGPNDDRLCARISYAAAGVFLLGILLLTFASSVHSVAAGEVGIVRRFGNIVGQRDSGLQWTAPWEDLDTVDIKAQRFTNAQATDGKLPDPYVAFSKETQDTFMRVTLVYHVASQDVQTLIRTASLDYFNRLGIEAKLLTTLKEETVKYSAVDIAPNRETIRAAVKTRLADQLGALSIHVDDFLIDNIDFSDQFKKAIEDKQQATQNAQAAQNVVEQKKAEAEQARQAAQGTADALVINAKGVADSNALIAASLTPAVLQYQAIQKLSDNVQIALIPSGQGLIIDPSSFLKPSQP